jgi:hypothetical protein
MVGFTTFRCFDIFGHFAQQLRNQILEEARSRSSPIGRAGAEQLKAGGKSLESLIDEKTAKLFSGKRFADLQRLKDAKCSKLSLNPLGSHVLPRLRKYLAGA